MPFAAPFQKYFAAPGMRPEVYEPFPAWYNNTWICRAAAFQSGNGLKACGLTERKGIVMEKSIESYILDSLPHPVIFVDTDHIIRYMNKEAKYRYYEQRGYRELIGKSLFNCHNEKSAEMIRQAVERLKNHGKESFIGLSDRNERIYLNPVRDENGELLGYFERFEFNIQK